MGELVILSDVRGWTPNDRAELLLEWRLIGERLALGELAARVLLSTPSRHPRADATVLSFPQGEGAAIRARGARR